MGTQNERAKPSTSQPVILNIISMVTIAMAFVMAVVAVVTRLLGRKERAQESPPGLRSITSEQALSLGGLTEAEAAARYTEGQDNTLLFKPPRSKEQIWESNIRSIYNVSLLSMAVVQLLLGKPLDALLSVLVMGLNIGLNVGQEMLARRRLAEVERATRARATVIRAGQASSIDPSGIVQGDILVAGPGDYILVDGLVVGDGQLAIDESMLTGKAERQVKRADDAVYAGSFCISGRAAYEAHQVGDERLIVTLTDKAQPAKEELTPLERIIDRVLRFLLVFVALFVVISLIRYFQLDEYVPVDPFMSAISVIFNIAPASLYFMIFVTYATGTADLGKLGALVHRARSVESLAQTNVLCFAKAGVLTGVHVEVETLDTPEGYEPVADARLRQILGDYARSTTVTNQMTRIMTSNFPGNPRAIEEQAPFLAVHGWNGITFDDGDLRGTYVMGDPRILEAHLVAPADEADDDEGEEESEEQQAPAWRRIVSPVGRLFGRVRRGTPDEETQVENAEDIDRDAAPTVSESSASALDTPEAESPDALEPPEEGAQEAQQSRLPGFFRRVTSRLPGLPGRKKATPEEKVQEEQDQVIEEVGILFACHPEPVALHDEAGTPRLPGDLVPLCKLHYSEQVRPEAIKTMQAFSQMGMEIKVFTTGSPDRTTAILQQAGLGGESETPLRTILGADLAESDHSEWARPGSGHTVFGYLSPEQAGQVVEILRQEGQAVTVVGNAVSDLPAMQLANLAIAMQGSSQAALSVADIVVMEDSPQALLRVLEKGQRIVNGLLDVLKLYLTQMFYLLFLIPIIAIFSYGFPYHSSQSTVISLATVALPAIVLTLWAAPGILPTAKLSWLLARFVGPSALSMGLAALIVYQVLLWNTRDVAYAQLGVTWTLVAMGLVLVVFIKPPGSATLSGGVQVGDWRPTALVGVLFIVFLVVCSIPLAQDLLRVGWLESEDLGLVAGVVIVWAIVLWLAYRILPVSPKWRFKSGS